MSTPSNLHIQLSDPPTLDFFTTTVRRILQSQKASAWLVAEFEDLGTELGLHPLDVQNTLQESMHPNLALNNLDQFNGNATGGNTIERWTVRVVEDVIEIHFGNLNHSPQYAAWHLNSSYLRLIPAESSGWGTSIILMPCLWSQDQYHQGRPISVRWQENGAELRMTFVGMIEGLIVRGIVDLHPPEGGMLLGEVVITTEGTPSLDVRFDAFKPLMLSSMHITHEQWDTSHAYVEQNTFFLPNEGQSIHHCGTTHCRGRVFGLEGGTSSWKRNTPTIEILLDREMPIMGWITPTMDPNKDNIGIFPVHHQAIRAWSYRILAKSLALP